MSKKKNSGLTRRASGLMALEPRFMFDGAAVTEAVNTALDAQQADHAEADSSAAKNLFSLAEPTGAVALVQAQINASQLISDFLAQPNARTQLFQIFNGGRNDVQPSEQWLAAYDSLVNEVQQGQSPVLVELLRASDLKNLLGAFAEQGLAGERVVYLNADWIQSGVSSQAIELVLAEEFGHAIDAKLNQGHDSTGDEGHAFASLLFNGAANAMSAGSEIDQRVLSIGGQQVSVEAAAPYAIAQTHYVPMAEADIKTSLYSISTAVTGNIQTVIAITATSNGTVVVYDHWEDGYETDINNPLQSTTKVWTYNGGKWFVDTDGDGTQDAGESEVSANQSVILYNAVNPSTDSSTVVDYDGRDKIGSTKAVTVVRAGWSATPGTVLAGAVNLIDSGNSGLTYTLPVGQNVETVATATNKLFEYTSAHITATQNGTTVNIDKDGNGTTDVTVSLNEGQTYLVNGGLNAGAKITADKGVGVYLIAGDVGSAYENRWFALTPDEQWSDSYFAPVGTTLAADPAYVLLYNPGSSAITVNYETATGSGTVIVPATGSRTAYYLMPSSAAHFYTTNGSKFYAVSVIDGDATSNATHDWSYSLVPDRFLTDKFVVGWGPGADNVTRTLASGDLNGSPVWVTPTANTTLYVDSTTVQMKDGSGKVITGTVDVGNGRTAFVVNKLQSYRIFDNDKDQTGLTAYTLDGTLITAAWGEDPSIAGAGTPYLDMGTTVTPYPDYVFTKESAEASTATYGVGVSDDDQQVELGEQIEYTLNLTNRSVVDLFGINIRDAISPSDAATYVANSTHITITRADGTVIVNNALVPDALDATPFPLLRADGGYTITDVDPNTAGLQGLERGDQIVITYRVQVRPDVNASLIAAGFAITNDADMSGNGASTPIKFSDNNTIISAAGTADGQVFFKNSTYSNVVSTYAEGDTIGLEVSDADANQSTSVADTLSVTVTNTTTGEIEQVTLTETGVNSGVFRSTLVTNPIAALADNDGTLQLRQGQSIQVDYIDPVFGAAFDNPTNPGVAGDSDNSIVTGNSNTATASVPVPSQTKILYLSDNSANNLDRVMPADSDVTAASTALINASATSTAVTITDDFSTAPSSGSGWSGNWTQTSDDSSWTDGTVRIQNGVMYLRGGHSSTDSVEREFSALSSSALLSFSIKDVVKSNNTLGDSETISVYEKRSDNGWYLVGTVLGSQINSSSNTTMSMTLSSGAKGIRFVNDGNDSDDRVYIDDLKITSGSVSTSNSTGTTDYALSSSVSAGQTFSFSTASADAININSLTLSLKKTGSTSATATVSVRNSWDGAILWSGTVSTRDLGTSYQDISIGVSNLTLDKSATYVLQVDSNNSGIVWQGSTANPYSSGTRLNSSGTATTGDMRFSINGQESQLSSVTFTQGLSMATDFTIPTGGVIKVVTYVTNVTGLDDGQSITATLSSNGAAFATASTPDYDASAGTLTWTFAPLSNAKTIAAGQAIKLAIQNGQASTSFKIAYDSGATRSRIELPTTTVIDIVDADTLTAGVQEVGFFDQSFVNGGQPITNGVIDAGGIVYIRVKVVDPFGDYDISSLNVSIDDGAGGATAISLSLDDAYVVDVASDGRAYKTYEYAWQTEYNIGSYAINVTANEGAETGAQAITDVAASSFLVQERDLGTPSTTMFLTNLASAGGIQAGALYSSTTNRAYLRITDLDQSGVPGTTVTAVVNGYTVLLTQTLTPGIFEADLGLEANQLSNTNGKTNAEAAAYFTNMPNGTVLTATYTDPNDSSDTSNDSISVNSTPDATPNAQSIGMDKQASGNVLTDADGVDTDPDGQALTVTEVNGNSANIGDTITLASGARLLVKSDGSYIYDPSSLLNANKPTAGSPYVDTFAYTISDGKGGTDTASVTITVTYVDPTALDNQANTDGSSVEFDVSNKFSDQTGVDNFVITNLPTGLTYDPLTGIISGTLAAGASTSAGTKSYTVSVTARDDADSNLVTRTFTWTINNVVPVAVNDANSTSIDVAVSGNVMPNDRDGSPDSDTLTVTKINGANYTINTNIATTHGTVKITNASTGAYTYTPTAGYTGLDSFTYTISDGAGGTSSATVTLSIIGVTDVTVNEASPWAVFEVSGVASEAVTLALAEGTAKKDANGTPLTDGTEDFGPSIQCSIDNGATWNSYTPGTTTLNSSGKLLVRTQIINDLPYEGGQTFTLSATNAGGASDVGVGTIKDDGTGNIYKNDGSTDSSATKNDDRGITVNGLDNVSEGSNAIFTVSLPDGNTHDTEISLALSDVSTDSTGGSPDDFSSTFTAYYYNGSTQVPLVITGGKITLPSGVTTFYVQVPTIQDTTLEGGEDFKLTATITGGKSANDTSTILDDGSGQIYDDKGLNPAGPGNDDRSITVSGLDDVSEGSNAVFTVTLPGGNARNTEISLSLSDVTTGSTSGSPDDYSSTFTAYYYNGSTQVPLVITGGKITLPSGIATFYVKVLTTQDAIFETSENFKLTATITGGKSANDTSTIVDDGSGQIYDDKGLNPVGPGDDDRPKSAAPLPRSLPPAVPPAEPLAELAPPPAKATPTQGFSSTLTPLAPALVPTDPPLAMLDAVTSGSGFQIPVSESAAPGLNLYQGITDQFVQTTDAMTKVSLPFDAFIHSNKDAVIKLESKQVDNSKLPAWVQFDPASGVFQVTPPKGFKGKLDLKVVARDDDGREAVAIFQMFIGEQTTTRPQSRDSFTEKLRMAGKRPMTLVRVSDVSHKVTARDTLRTRAG